MYGQEKTFFPAYSATTKLSGLWFGDFFWWAFARTKVDRKLLFIQNKLLFLQSKMSLLFPE